MALLLFALQMGFVLISLAVMVWAASGRHAFGCCRRTHIAAELAATVAAPPRDASRVAPAPVAGEEESVAAPSTELEQVDGGASTMDQKAEETLAASSVTRASPGASRARQRATLKAEADLAREAEGPQDGQPHDLGKRAPRPLGRAHHQTAPGHRQRSAGRNRAPARTALYRRAPGRMAGTMLQKLNPLAAA